MNCEVMTVRKIEGAGNLKAFIDVRLADCLVVRSCAVMQGKQGLFCSLPRQATRDGLWREVVVCTDDQVKAGIYAKIMDAYINEAAVVA